MLPATSMICLALLAIAMTTTGGGADKLPIAFCTPEHSQCSLASDGNADTCFAAAGLHENFYFAVFNTLGSPVSVDKLTLRVDGASQRRTEYAVSLASGPEAHDLHCSSSSSSSSGRGDAAVRIIECPAAMHNVTSMMVRPKALLTRLNLLEVAAFRADGGRVNFTYCVAPDADDEAACRVAMDGTAAADSRPAVSQPAQFPAWYGGLGQPELIRSVRIYRPAEAAANTNAKANATTSTFFRVHAGGADCRRVAESTDAGVEAIEFQCDGPQPTSLVQVWQVDAQFLMRICEVDVFGEAAAV